MTVSETEKKIQAAVVAYREGTEKRWDFCERAEAIVGTYTNGATRDLAGRLGISVSQVENYARAWLGWHSCTLYVKDEERLQFARSRLTISHWTTLADAWKQLEFHIKDGFEIMYEIAKADKIPTVQELKGMLYAEYGDGGIPEWQERFQQASKVLRKAIDDYGVPEEFRQRALFLLDYEPGIKVYKLQDHRVVSWNKLYEQKHWSQRADIANQIHGFVRAVLDPEDCVLKIPVDILIVAYSKSNPADSDNICAKLYIDGLKGWVIPDDDPRSVQRVTVRSEQGKENEVMIVVTECPGAKPWEPSEETQEVEDV